VDHRQHIEGSALAATACTTVCPSHFRLLALQGSTLNRTFTVIVASDEGEVIDSREVPHGITSCGEPPARDHDVMKGHIGSQRHQ
jgi:hypothetical protein